MMKTVLQTVAVPVFGLIMLNAAFIFDWGYQSLLRYVILKPLMIDAMMIEGHWLPPAMHASFVVIIGLISWPILKSKLNTLIKAIYLTVPTAVVFATVGIFLYKWPVIEFTVGGIISLGVLYYLYATKKSWLYYYAICLVGAALLAVGILGIDI